MKNKHLVAVGVILPSCLLHHADLQTTAAVHAVRAFDHEPFALVNLGFETTLVDYSDRQSGALPPSHPDLQHRALWQDLKVFNPINS